MEASPDVVKAYRRVKDLTPFAKFARPAGIAIDDEDRIIISETVAHGYRSTQRKGNMWSRNSTCCPILETKRADAGK